MLNGSKVNDTIYFDNVGYTIPDNAFSSNLDLINVISKFTSGGVSCFNSCSSLLNIDAQDLITLGESSFAGCTNLIGNFENLQNAGIRCFSECTNLNTSFNNLINIGFLCFENCTSLENFDFSNVDNFGTDSSNNGVFSDITGKTITVTAKIIHQTSNGGNLDGDLQYLADNNTVTFNWV